MKGWRLRFYREKFHPVRTVSAMFKKEIRYFYAGGAFVSNSAATYLHSIFRPCRGAGEQRRHLSFPRTTLKENKFRLVLRFTPVVRVVLNNPALLTVCAVMWRWQRAKKGASLKRVNNPIFVGVFKLAMDIKWSFSCFPCNVSLYFMHLIVITGSSGRHIRK